MILRYPKSKPAHPLKTKHHLEGAVDASYSFRLESADFVRYEEPVPMLQHSLDRLGEIHGAIVWPGIKTRALHVARVHVDSSEIPMLNDRTPIIFYQLIKSNASSTARLLHPHNRKVLECLYDQNREKAQNMYKHIRGIGS